MKKIILPVLSLLFLFSCKKEDGLPRVETITGGNKWTLQTGSSPAEVYAQLQQLSEEKEIDEVAVVYRQPFSAPEEVKAHLPFYNAITLQNNTGRIERVLLQFSGETVHSIAAGGGRLDEVSEWPLDVPDEIRIRPHDPISELYQKLLAIYERPLYNQYQIILPNKSLAKPFDPDMANYTEWAFTFPVDVKENRTGTSSVRLYFTHGKLNKIRHEYNEADVFN